MLAELMLEHEPVRLSDRSEEREEQLIVILC